MFGERFDDALVFASRLHRGQTRKVTGVPYIAHLLAVASLVAEDGGTEDEAIAALLHDAIEDQGAQHPGGRSALRAEIGARFGSAVLAIVDGCTDDEAHPKLPLEDPAARRAQWMARKQAHLACIAAAPMPVRRVCCADKLHNLRSMLRDYRTDGETLWSRFRTQSRADQIWYYSECARIFHETSPGPMSAELTAACAALAELGA